MTIRVPIEEAAKVRDELTRFPLTAVGGVMAAPIRALLDFVEQFELKALPGMTQETVAGECKEIRLVDDSLEAESFSLIRLNGRVFVPEVIEAELEIEQPADVAKLVEALRNWPASDKDGLSASVVGELMASAANVIVTGHSALKLALGHIDHMADYITNNAPGYSFESLGEDSWQMRAPVGFLESDVTKIEDELTPHGIAAEALVENAQAVETLVVAGNGEALTRAGVEVPEPLDPEAATRRLFSA